MFPLILAFSLFPPNQHQVGNSTGTNDGGLWISEAPKYYLTLENTRKSTTTLSNYFIEPEYYDKLTLYGKDGKPSIIIIQKNKDGTNWARTNIVIEFPN